MTMIVEQTDIFEAVLDAVPDSVTVVDRYYRIQFQNTSNRQIYGALKGRTCFAAYRGRSTPCEDCVVGEVLRDGKQRRSIHDVSLPSGETVLVEISAAPLRNAEGVVVAAVEVARDVTAQKKAEALLSRSLLEKDKTLRAYLQELDSAAGYIRTVLPSRLASGRITTDWLFLPSAALGGDAFGYHWIGPEHFAMYLIDVSGHGWAAALLSVSIVNVLRSQSLPRTDFLQPGEVLFNLNNAFPGERHNDMFFSVWYGVYDASTGVLIYASGGHPPAVVMGGVDAGKAALQLCRTGNFILGGRRDIAYLQDKVRITAPSRLFIFSDGVYEFSTPSGAVWGLKAFVQALGDTAEQGWPSTADILAMARRAAKTGAFEDDFSLLQVTFT